MLKFRLSLITMVTNLIRSPHQHLSPGFLCTKRKDIEGIVMCFSNLSRHWMIHKTSHLSMATMKAG